MYIQTIDRTHSRILDKCVALYIYSRKTFNISDFILYYYPSDMVFIKINRNLTEGFAAAEKILNHHHFYMDFIYTQFRKKILNKAKISALITIVYSVPFYVK